ncbi:MAG: cobalt-precorrin-6A reductase [Cyanobacteria bacterium P01_A01_bin.70]
MRRRLWLIGGTQESRQLVARLSAFDTAATIVPAALLITVTTEAARSLYPPEWTDQIWVGQVAAPQGDDFVRDYQIGAILDLSHPFAAQISRQAIALAQRHQLPYLRYERSVVKPPLTTWRDRRGRPGRVELAQFADLWQADYLSQERTLLTIGSRLLPQFAPWQTECDLFVRILPSPPALAAALAAGFAPDRILALRPPLSPALEKALWQQWHITQVVTKASGTAGGEDHKQAIAAELGVRLIQIARPQVPYPQQTDRLDTALQFAIRYATQWCDDWRSSPPDSWLGAAPCSPL